MRRFLLLSTLALFAAVHARADALVPAPILVEAETPDGRVGDAGFATTTAEASASGGQVALGLYRDGWAEYTADLPTTGLWTLWARCAVPGPKVVIALDLDGLNTGTKTNATLTQTSGRLDGPGAYQWRRLADARRPAGPWRFAIGKGAIRIDVFLLAPSNVPPPTDDALRRAATAADTPRGERLPELTHDRRITRHPKWLSSALRPCYAHFEWDSQMTADTWARLAGEHGANCLFGCGEMPAGALDGKLKTFPHSTINRTPDFRFPEDYDLSYDWVKDMADAAHRHGLPIAIYDGSHRTLDPLLVEHPEWRQQDAAGRPYADGFGSWHSPYRQAYIDRWARVARLARMDGIMIDMLFTGPRNGDYSPWTVDAFRKHFGTEPPRTPDPRNLTWQRWIDFQAWTREEMLLDLTTMLHDVSPEIAVIVNQTRGWIFGRIEGQFLTTRTAACCDGLLEEMGWEYRHNWNRPWAWPLEAAWQNLFLHCRTRPGYGQMWHVSTLNYPETHALAHSFAMLANGAAPGMVTGGNWPVMARVWTHTKACESWIEGAALVPHVALHVSEDALAWYAAPAGDEALHAYMENVFGIFQALLETHLPVELVTDDDLVDATVLARHAVLVLPNSACLSDRQAATVAAFVERGGGLVTTFETGTRDANGVRRDTPALANVLGAAQATRTNASAWSMPLDGLDHPILDDPRIRAAGAWRQGVSDPAPYAYLYAGSRARVVAATPVAVTDSEAFTFPLSGGGRPPKGHALLALIARAAGQGRTVFFPLDLGRAYYVFNHPVNRHLIANAIAWAAARPAPLRTDAPLAVQTVLWEKGPARVVHLVNDVSSFGRAAAPNPEAFTAFRDEVLPVHDIRVGVPGDFAAARLLPDGSALPVVQTDGWSEAVVPRLDIHAMIVFEPALH